jgi:hypothetical protein
MSENNVVSLTGRVLIRNSSRKHSVLPKSGNGASRKCRALYLTSAYAHKPAVSNPVADSELMFELDSGLWRGTK